MFFYAFRLPCLFVLYQWPVNRLVLKFSDSCIILNVVCSSCNRNLSFENYSFRDKKRSILNKVCKTCHSKYRKKHYLDNKEKYIEKAKSWNQKQKAVLRGYIFQVLENSQCVDCGEKDVIVLEFDHLSNKKLSITQMYRNSSSLQSIKKEVEKCVVRCVNCHRRKTANQFNFWRLKMNES